MVKSSSSILRVYSFMHNISVSWILQRVHPMHIYTGSILKTNENRWELSGREEKQVWNSIGLCPFALLLEIWKRDSRTAGSSLTYPPTYKTFLVMCPPLDTPSTRLLQYTKECEAIFPINVIKSSRCRMQIFPLEQLCRDLSSSQDEWTGTE